MNEHDKHNKALEIPIPQLRSESDDLARRELRAFADDSRDLEDEARRAAHKRTQGRADAISHCERGLIYVGWVVLVGMILTWGYNIIMPSSFRGLNQPELDHLQNILFSGALSSALTMLAQKSSKS